MPPAFRTALLVAVGGAAAGSAYAADGGESPWLAVVVLGIPLSVLFASLVGSSVRALKESAPSPAPVPRRALLAVLDGLIGGWLAMLLTGFTATAPYLAAVSPEVVGAFGGLLTEFARSNAARWWESLWVAILSRIHRSPGDAP